jgi:hypothetical protein
MGLWHIYTEQNARFASEHFEVDLGYTNPNTIVQRDKQALQEILTSGIGRGQQEELQLENEKLRIWSGHIVRHMADTTQWKPLKDQYP